MQRSAGRSWWKTLVQDEDEDEPRSLPVGQQGSAGRWPSSFPTSTSGLVLARPQDLWTAAHSHSDQRECIYSLWSGIQAETKRQDRRIHHGTTTRQDEAIVIGYGHAFIITFQEAGRSYRRRPNYR